MANKKIEEDEVVRQEAVATQNNLTEQNELTEHGFIDAVMAEVMEEVIEETIDAIDSNSFVFREGIDCSKLLIGLKVLEKRTAAKQNNVTEQEVLPQKDDELNEESDANFSLRM